MFPLPLQDWTFNPSPISNVFSTLQLGFVKPLLPNVNNKGIQDYLPFVTMEASQLHMRETKEIEDLYREHMAHNGKEKMKKGEIKSTRKEKMKVNL